MVVPLKGSSNERRTKHRHENPTIFDVQATSTGGRRVPRPRQRKRYITKVEVEVEGERERKRERRRRRRRRRRLVMTIMA